MIPKRHAHLPHRYMGNTKISTRLQRETNNYHSPIIKHPAK